MDGRSSQLSEHLRAGAFSGVLAWSAYAIVEGTFLLPIPWLSSPAHLYKPSHAGLTLLSWSGYLVAGIATGAVAGTVSGLLSRRRAHQSRPHVIPELTTLALVVSLTTALWLVSPPQRSVWVVGGIALVLAWWQLCRILRPSVPAPPGAAATACAIVGSAWVVNDLLWFHTTWFRLVGMLVVAVACVAGCLLARVVSGSSWTAPLKLSASSALGGRVLALSLLMAAAGTLAQKPLRQGIEKPSALSGRQVRPPVVLIVMDTTRADHLSLYGYERRTTPRLEELARDSMVFAAAIAPSSFTLPSHASMFTGLYPSQHGATSMRRPLRQEFSTLAEVLGREGYATRAVVANVAYLRPTLGLSQGFEYYDQREPIHFLAGSKPYLLRTVVGRLARSSGVVPEEPHYRRGEEITQEALRLIDEASLMQDPLLLFVNYMDSHDPYLPPAPYDHMFPGRNDGFDWGPTHRSSSWQKLTASEKAHVVSQYDGAVAYVDAQIGRVIQALRRHQLYDKSLIIIVGDHGEALGRHQFWGHGTSVYQDQVHVPLLIKLPLVRERKDVRDTISIVDVFYTVLDIVGAPFPAGTAGLSLVRRQDAQPRVLAEHTLEEYDRVRESVRAVYADGMKLIRHSSGASELYDLTKDPDEMSNLYPRHASAPSLEGTLLAWERAVQKDSRSATPLDPDTAESLRSLGYIQ
jgi:arylsulfatase A-like enzyme